MYYSPLHLAAMAYSLTDSQQSALIDSCANDPSTLAILAARPDLSAQNAEKLSKSSNLKVRRLALRKVTDVTILKKALNSDVYAVSVAANVNTPAGMLDHILRYGSSLSKIRAACNKSTPEQSRKEVLADETVVTKLVHVGSSLGDKVVKSYELVNANAWLANIDGYDKYDLNIKRAIIGNYTTSKETILYAAKNLRLKHAWSSLKNHPYLHNAEFASMSLSDLAASEACASDMYLIDHPMVDCVTASVLLVNKFNADPYFTKSSLRQVDPEPQVIAKLAARFGNLCFLTKNRSGNGFAGTRITSAAWSEPCVADYANVTLPDPFALCTAVNLLGSDKHTWDTYIALSRDWQDSPLELAKVATTL